MAANNEQGIQLEYLSKIDIKQTNEWLDSVTVEQIAALNDEPFDGSIYSKLLNLPAIEDPKGLTDVFWLEGVNSPMMFFKDLLDKKRQLIRCHVLMAIIMLDKGPKGIVRTPEQEQEFFEIFKKIKELDLKAQKLDTLAFIFFKKFLADTFVFEDIERDFVFNVDALFMHSVNFVEELILFEQSLPDWWKINKIVLDSKAYLPHCINLSAGGLCTGFHPGDSVSDFYQKIHMTAKQRFADTIRWMKVPGSQSVPYPICVKTVKYELPFILKFYHDFKAYKASIYQYGSKP